MQTLIAEIRRHLPSSSESKRLFHGRGRCFPGFENLTIDYFQPVVLVIAYGERQESWWEEFSCILKNMLPGVEAILLQERHLQGAPARLLWGELPEKVYALEDDLRYCLRLGEAQNIGFFPDMVTGRSLVREIAKNKKVLNLFSYTCSFSVAALAGGAIQVVNLDMNRGALELGRVNHQINGFDLRNVSFLSLELFKSFGKLRKIAPFDLIICDPPATQGRSFTAERDWPKLLRKLPQLLNPGGEIVACLNAPHLAPDFLDLHFQESLPDASLVGKYSPGEDFPEATSNMGVSIHHYKVV